MNAADTGDLPRLATSIRTNIGRVMAGQSASIRRILAAFLAGGHVLLEDNPGTGKTTLAKALARSVSAEFRRVQFTPFRQGASGLDVEAAREALRLHYRYRFDPDGIAQIHR